MARAFSLMATAPLFSVVIAMAFLADGTTPLLLAGALAIAAGSMLLARARSTRRAGAGAT